jgi:hypothetical protein
LGNLEVSVNVSVWGTLSAVLMKWPDGRWTVSMVATGCNGTSTWEDELGPYEHDDDAVHGLLSLIDGYVEGIGNPFP